MTDEKLAEEWWNNWVVKDWNDLQEGKRLFIQAFFAGLNVGRLQWHDLRKDKNDLPDNSRFVWCDYGDDCGKGYYSRDDGGWWIEGHMFYSAIDAWCELPTFDKE